MMAGASKGEGRLCAYCDRKMTQGIPHLRPTRDHVIPKSKQGRETVWACFFCNNLKGAMMPDDWRAFMRSYPRWWENDLFAAKSKKRAPSPARNRIPKPPPLEQTRNFLAQANARATMRIPASVPVEYSDPIAQAGFERIYATRLRLLRVPASSTQQEQP